MGGVYVLSERKPIYLELFEQHGLSACESASQAEVLLADPPLLAEHVHSFQNVKWIQSTFAGVDSLAGVTIAKECCVTGVKGIFGPLIAEYVFGHGLSHSRHVDFYRQQQVERGWKPVTFEPIEGLSLLILGTGSIGQHLAQVAQAFGMATTGLNSQARAVKGFDEVVDFEGLPLALAKASWVVNTLPHTPLTSRLLDRSLLNNCKQVLFFNVGRGSIVDSSVLIEALNSDCLAHAFLDVFEEEPLASDHALWSHPKVSVTPHVAAPSLPEQVFKIFFENYRRFEQGLPLQYKVDLQKGY